MPPWFTTKQTPAGRFRNFVQSSPGHLDLKRTWPALKLVIFDETSWMVTAN